MIPGPDHALKRTVTSFLGSLSLNPIELSSAEIGPNLLDRFEHYASDTYAVVLLAPAPGQPPRRRHGEPKLAPAPAQVFAAGFLIGKFGRRSVAVLHRDEIELPPALTGALGIPLDEIGIWKFALMRDLVAAGFAVKQNLAVYRPRQSPAPAPTLDVRKESG